MPNPQTMIRIAALLLVAPLAAGCRDDTPPTLAPASASAGTPVSFPAATYIAVDLGTLGGANSNAQAINVHGRVVGWSDNAAGLQRGFTGTPPGALREHGSNRAWDVNASGQVVGTSGGFAIGTPYTRSWPGAALAVNGAGTAAGYRTGPSGMRAVIGYGGVQELGVLPGGTYSVAEDLNDLLHVVGYGDTPAGTRAFIARYPGPMQDLGVLPGGTASAAFAINNARQVVGYSTVAGEMRAFVWTEAEGMRDLGTLPGGGASRAYDVNASGQIVGYAVAADGQRHAVLWTYDGTDYSITDLGGVGGAYPSVAHGINDAGVIVGYTRVGTANHATRWSAAPVAPVARIAGPDTIWAGTPVEFTAAGSHASVGSITGYEWGFNEQGDFNYSTTRPSILHAFDLAGTRVAYVRVRNTAGVMDTAAMTLVVIPNHPPVAEIGVDTVRAGVGYRIDFSGRASSDPDAGQPLRFRWSFGGVAESSAMDTVWRFRTAGVYPVTLTVTDASDASDTDQVLVVVEDTPPFLTLSLGPVVENTPFMMTVAVNDSATDSDSLDFALDCGSGYAPFGSTRTARCPGMPEGDSTEVGAKVRDGHGVVAEQRAVVTAVDVPPQVNFVSAGRQDGIFTIVFVFNDPGAAADGPYQYRVVWGDGSETAWAPVAGGKTEVSRPDYPPGTYTLTVSVTDGAGIVGSASREVTGGTGS